MACSTRAVASFLGAGKTHVQRIRNGMAHLISKIQREAIRGGDPALSHHVLQLGWDETEQELGPTHMHKRF